MNFALAMLAVVCWSVCAVATAMSATRMSPLMVQVVVAYAYSALAPALFLLLKLRGQHPDWNPSGVAWAVAACLSATVAGLAMAVAASRAPTTLP